MLAANGTVTIANNAFSGSIVADGGIGNNRTVFRAQARAVEVRAGAIRVIATAIGGTGHIFARGGRRNDDSVLAGSGAIRLEAISNTLGVSLTDPVASRT